MTHFALERCILLCRAGSHAYGTNVATSDEDFRGVCVAPRKYYTGLQSFEQHEERTPNDLVIYECRKFVRLAANCNPNIIETLFTPPVVSTSAGSRLQAAAGSFLSKRAALTFGGYAQSQLAKLAKQNDAGRDWKNAMHLVRLLRMAAEIVRDKQVIVRRPDAAELLGIRRGERSYEWVLDHAAELQLELHAAKAASTLPDQPDMEALDQLCQEIVWERLNYD